MTVRQDGANLPGGQVWEPTAVVDLSGVRRHITDVIDDVGFFVWP